MGRSKNQNVDKTRQTSPAGLIIRQREPTNLEMPFDQVDSYLTPTELFYIRSHFPVPRLDVSDYELRIDGGVRNPVDAELPGIAGDAVRDADRHFGVRQ
jgi:DMSO/TMAO reductase YedYZ molybdopterin-dependent catalytic subunit